MTAGCTRHTTTGKHPPRMSPFALSRTQYVPAGSLLGLALSVLKVIDRLYVLTVSERVTAVAAL